MNAKQKHGAFDLAFEKFKAAYKSILALDRKKLLLAKAAGAALIQMKQDKRCTVGQLLHILNGLGINISQDTHNRYVNVATRWDEMVAIAKQRNINLETLGYMEALDLLPPSEHAQRVKAGKQRTMFTTEPGSAPQKPPADWHGRVIASHGSQPAAAVPPPNSEEPGKCDAGADEQGTRSDNIEAKENRLSGLPPVHNAFKLLAGKPLIIDATSMTLEVDEGHIKINAPDGQNMQTLLLASLHRSRRPGNTSTAKKGATETPSNSKC